MASQTILIVDDSPVNLKLTDIVLRKEGFEVHAAANAEQALLILRGFRPDLMIVDIQLPGISGVELTRRVRQDPRLLDVPVVALTASASKEDEQRALEAGCNGYLTKPIETRTLGKTIRQFLEPEPAREQPVPEAPPIPAGLSFRGPEMEGLRRRFLEEGILQSRQMLESLRINFDVERAGSTVHRWVGAAGVLGYTAISSLSREAGDVLGAPKLDRGRLREVLSELALAFLDPREATIGALPEGIAQEISGKRVAMIEFAPEEAERLCTALDHVGALPRMFGATEPGDSRSLRECHVIVVHVRPESPVPLWLLAGEPGPNRPTVLLGGRDAIMALPRQAQSLVREYLIDGWEPEEALLRLSFAIFRNRSSETAPASSMSPPRRTPLGGAHPDSARGR